MSDEATIGSAAARIVPPARHVERVKKRDLFADVFGLELPQSGHIASPQTASVSGHNDFAVFRMDRHVMDRDGWQALVERRPVLSSIDRYPQREFGTEIQKAWVDQILPQAASRAPWQTGVEGVERFPKVFGNKRIRVIIIGSVAIQADVDTTFVVP